MAGTPSAVIGARQVSNINSVDRVRNVSPVVLMLQDDRKNLMTYLQGLGTESTDNYEFEWIQDEIIPNRGTTAGTGALASAASGAAATVNLGGTSTSVYLRTDEQVYLPATGEIMRVASTPTSATAVPVVRNVPGGATASTPVGTLWINIGDNRAGLTRLFTSAAGSSLDAISLKNAFSSNFTQTFEEPFGLSRREGKSKLYSGKDESTQKTKSLMQHCEKIEHAFWFGKKLEETNERTSTGGVLYWLTNGGAVNTTVADITQVELDDFVNRVTRYGNKKRRVLFCSRMMAVKISQFAYENQRIQSTGSSVKYGVHVDSIRTAGGTDVDIVTCDALEGIPGAAKANHQGHDGTGVLLDMTGKKKVVFGGDDLKYAEGLEYKDMIGDKVNAYLSDVGYKPGDARKDGKITDTNLS